MNSLFHVLYEMMEERGYILELEEENTLLFKKKSSVKRGKDIDNEEEEDRHYEKGDVKEDDHKGKKGGSKEEEEEEESKEENKEENKSYDNSDNVIVFFPVENKVNIDTIKEILYKMEQIQIKNCIIVYKESITSSAKKALDVLELNIEMFHLEQLQYNITKHSLVPKHVRVDNKREKKELLQKYGSQLPILLRSDAVSRFYNYKKGDLIKILRNNNTVCYRKVS